MKEKIQEWEEQKANSNDEKDNEQIKLLESEIASLK
jgi:hypothetical protein